MHYCTAMLVACHSFSLFEGEEYNYLKDMLALLSGTPPATNFGLVSSNVTSFGLNSRGHLKISPAANHRQRGSQRHI